VINKDCFDSILSGDSIDKQRFAGSSMLSHRSRNTPKPFSGKYSAKSADGSAAVPLSFGCFETIPAFSSGREAPNAWIAKKTGWDQ
jgi:hypothetical protein